MTLTIFESAATIHAVAVGLSHCLNPKYEHVNAGFFRSYSIQWNVPRAQLAVFVDECDAQFIAERCREY